MTATLATVAVIVVALLLAASYFAGQVAGGVGQIARVIQ